MLSKMVEQRPPFRLTAGPFSALVPLLGPALITALGFALSVLTSVALTDHVSQDELMTISVIVHLAVMPVALFSAAENYAASGAYDWAAVPAVVALVWVAFGIVLVASLDERAGWAVKVGVYTCHMLLVLSPLWLYAVKRTCFAVARDLGSVLQRALNWRESAAARTAAHGFQPFAGPFSVLAPMMLLVLTVSAGFAAASVSFAISEGKIWLSDFAPEERVSFGLGDNAMVSVILTHLVAIPVWCLGLAEQALLRCGRRERQAAVAMVVAALLGVAASVSFGVIMVVRLKDWSTERQIYAAVLSAELLLATAPIWLLAHAVVLQRLVRQSRADPVPSSSPLELSLIIEN